MINAPDKLSQLITGLILLTFKREVEESCYSAIDMITFEHELLQRRNRYASDLKRVFDELRLTNELLVEVSGQKQTGHKTHGPEEIVNYYSGNFFDLVHQIKDKLFQLVASLITEKTESGPYKEPRRVSKKEFLKKYGEEIKKIGIHDILINKWGQEDEGPIGVVLRKRKQHHHYLSNLQLNRDCQNIQVSRLMLAPMSTGTLTEYGKQRMTELGEQSLKKMKDEVAERQRQTIKEIENNLNAIAEKLISFYSIPTESAERADIIKRYMDFLTSLEITNEASLDKIQPIIRPVISELVASVQKIDTTSSIYLVGSCGREDFVPGKSDINVYIISKNTKESLSFENKFPLVFTLLSEEDFLSDEHKKDRFICWSDGILLAGPGFKFEAKDFPKPGALLSLLLNHGFIEKLEALKNEVLSQQNPNYSQLRAYSLRMIKIMMDYDFGVAMTNKPFYTASRRKKIAYIKEVFPNERRPFLLEQVYNGGTIKQEDFRVFIDTFLEDTGDSYKHLLDIHKKTLPYEV